MINSFKEGKYNILVLLLIVGILSLTIYGSVFLNKEYTKNVSLDIETYNYNDDKSKGKVEFIKLNSIIPLKNYIIDINHNEDEILVISNDISNIYINEINLSNIKISSKIIKTKILNDEQSIYYQSNGISPSKEILIYSKPIEKLNSNYPMWENNTIIYNIKENTKQTIEFKFRILSWMPDSSGFIGINENKLFFYDIEKKSIYNIKNIPENILIDKIQFSNDGSNIYVLISCDKKSRNELIIYDSKLDKIKKANINKYIYGFEVIDDENIIVQSINEDGVNIYNYNTISEKLDIIKNIKAENLYLNEDKTKLIGINSNEKNENIISIYAIKNENSKINLSLLGTIPEIKGIVNITMIEDDKLVYSISGTKDNESLIYIYDILDTNDKI